MKCPICDSELINGKCMRFPICNYVELTTKKETNAYVVFDIETTGLSKTKDRITEIAAIKVMDGEIIDEFTMLVNPGKDENGRPILISPRITQLTGITNQMVKNSPVETEAIKSFVDWLNACEDDFLLVGQNIIRFDVPFITEAAKRARYPFSKKHRCDDTLNIARDLKLKERGLVDKYSQPELAKYFKFTYHAHRALDDVKACQKIYELLKREKERM